MGSWLRQSWLVLLLAGSLGTALAVVEQSLEGRIAQNARERQERAVLEVVPDGVRSEPAPMNNRDAWQVFDQSGTVAGVAVIAESSGFSDRIRLMVGLSANRSRLLGVAVLESRETPGLGERIRESAFLDQFRDKHTDRVLQAVKPGQSAEQPVDAISGATISSNAVVRAINLCVSDVLSASLNQQTLDAVAGDGP